MTGEVGKHLGPDPGGWGVRVSGEVDHERWHLRRYSQALVRYSQVNEFEEQLMLEPRRDTPIMGAVTPILRALCWMQSCSEKRGQPYSVRCS